MEFLNTGSPPELPSPEFDYNSFVTTENLGKEYYSNIVVLSPERSKLFFEIRKSGERIFIDDSVPADNFEKILEFHLAHRLTEDIE